MKIIMFMNQTPIISHSKKQNTIEASSFGSDFFALRIVVENVIALRCKLKMFKIPLDGQTQVFCDSESVVKNSSYPESRLKIII